MATSSLEIGVRGRRQDGSQFLSEDWRRAQRDPVLDPVPGCCPALSAGTRDGTFSRRCVCQAQAAVPSHACVVAPQNSEEAYAMAKQHNQLDLYAQVLGSNGTPDVYRRIARTWLGLCTAVVQRLPSWREKLTGVAGHGRGLRSPGEHASGGPLLHHGGRLRCRH